MKNSMHSMRKMRMQKYPDDELKSAWILSMQLWTLNTAVKPATLWKHWVALSTL